MEVLVSRGCGLDVHQATVVACLLTGAPGRLPRKQVKTFSAMTNALIELRDWLKSEGCTAVAMEATGVYWKPVRCQRCRMDRRPAAPWIVAAKLYPAA